MAGIGFSLRKFMKRGSYFGLLQAYGFAGIISSGPWVLSIVGILIIGFFTVFKTTSPFINEFQISVAYLMAFSLLLTSPLQLLFTRFISDRMYEKRYHMILPNLFGAILLVITVSGILGSVILTYLFTASLLYRVLMLTGFTLLCSLWIVIIFLAGMKAYKGILFAFLIGYGITVGVALQLQNFGLEGLLAGFVLGQGVLLFMLLYLVLRSFSSSSRKFIAFDFLRRKKIFLSLAVTGFLYTFGLWADKLIFWFNPQTGTIIIAPLRASIIYDLPIFLAYLSIMPGMAIFLIRMETDFVEQYDMFYQAISKGESLQRIKQIHSDMKNVIRRAILDIIKVQGTTVIIFFIIGKDLLIWFGISPYYSILLNIDVVGVGVQVLLLAVLNLMFYFDYRMIALYLCLLFASFNVILTIISLYLGPAFYGYGFALATILATLVGFIIISRKLNRLIYETFMLRSVSS